MLVTSFAAEPAPTGPDVDDRARQGLKERAGALHDLGIAAGHDRERAGARAVRGAADGSVEDVDAARASGRVEPARERG